MRAQILEYLSNNQTGEFIPINDLLLRINNSPNHLQSVAWWLGSMEDTDVIQLSGQWGELGRNGKNLENTTIEARLRPRGLLEHQTNEERKWQNELTEKQVSSTLRTDTSVRDTNKIQQVSLIATGGVILISCCFQIASWIIAKNEYTLHKKQNTRQEKSQQADSLIVVGLKAEMNAIRQRIDSIEKNVSPKHK